MELVGVIYVGNLVIQQNLASVLIYHVVFVPRMAIGIICVRIKIKYLEHFALNANVMDIIQKYFITLSLFPIFYKRYSI